MQKVAQEKNVDLFNDVGEGKCVPLMETDIVNDDTKRHRKLK